jgi:trehalose/maltose hydrolase-like predicted phosphorylase
VKLWIALVLSLGLVRAQDVFEFTTRNYSDYGPTLVGNGYLFGATPWNGATATEAAVEGLYDHLQQDSYSYQALIPSWNEVDYFNGSHWLNQIRPGEASLSGYKQTLNAFRGTLSTRYDWLDSNRATHIEVTMFPVRQEPNLAVTQLRVTPDYGVTAGPITFSFPLGGPPGATFAWEGATLPDAIPIREVEPDADGRGFVAISETRDRKVRVAQAVRVIFPGNLRLHEVLAGVSTESSQQPRVNVKFIVNQGQTYAFTKLVATVTSMESGAFVERARALAAAAERSGDKSLLAIHEQAWKDLWTTDIRIQGDVEAQRAVHAAIFYLFSSIRREANASIPAVALPSRAYLGRIWWDAETFVFPSIVVLNPQLARSMVSYRCARLPEARTNAEMRGYHGALFPMESAETGREAAPEWSSEIHVTGDVALSQWRYFLETGDLTWLRDCGYPILRDVADFWSSRVKYVESAGDYEILDVTGPNEAIPHVNNDAYTNAVARRVMEVATEAARMIGASPNPQWARIAPKILIPYDAQKAHHLEHSGDLEGRYAHALTLLSYPLEMNFPENTKRNDLDLALKNFGKPGYEVGMMGNFYSIVASELGDRELAYRLFLDTMRSYAKPPFYVMSETPANNRFIFLTAEGAFLQQVIFGFTGLRFSSEGLSPKYPPLIPPAWQRLELRGVNVKGRKRTIRVESGKLGIE